MANGDDALAAGMDILDGNEDRRNGWDEINKSRDYIAQRTSAVTPVAKGGTGATTADAARANLGVPEIAGVNSAEAGKLPIYSPAAQLATATPTLGGHAASKGYVDDADAAVRAYADQRINGANYLPTSGGIVNGALRVTGSFIVPNASAASSGYVVAYIDGDGILRKGASSERYKKYISEIDPASLGDIWPQLVRYQMRGGDGAWKYGYIAEHLDASDALRPFVVYQTINEYDEDTDTYQTRLALDESGNPVPESIDFIALLMAQNAQLHASLASVTARLDALEAS